MWRLRAVLAGCLALIGSGALADTPRPVIVLEIDSYDQLDAELTAIVGPTKAGSARDLALGWLRPSSFADADWIDTARRVVGVATTFGPTPGASGFTLAVPTRDSEAGLAAMAAGAAVPAAGADGVRAFERTGEPTRYVGVRDGYLVLGPNRSSVAGFAMPAPIAGAPSGAMRLELDITALAPVAKAALGMLRPLSAAAATKVDPAAKPPAGAPDSPVMMKLLAPYIESFEFVLDHTERAILALGQRDSSAMVHLRLIPRPGGMIDEFLREQTVGFPSVARLVAPEGHAGAVWMASFRKTPALERGLRTFFGDYYAALEELVPSELSEMIAPQRKMTDRSLTCLGGEYAGYFAADKERGAEMVSVQNVRSGDDCVDFASTNLASVATLTGPDGKPLIVAGDEIVTDEGLRAQRFQVSEAVTSDAVPAGSPLAEAMFSAYGGYTGQFRDLVVSANGPEAATMLRDVSRRHADRALKGGLTAGDFAPLEVGAGFFVAADLRAIIDGVGRIIGQDETASAKVIEETPARFVAGLKFFPDRANIEMLLPAKFLRELYESDLEEESETIDEPTTATEKVARPRPAPESIRTLNDDLVLPVLTDRIQPIYPEAEKRAAEGAKVVLEAIIKTDGHPTIDSVLSCATRTELLEQKGRPAGAVSAECKPFADAATIAIEQWRYEPAKKAGKPVAVYLTVVVDFEPK